MSTAYGVYYAIGDSQVTCHVSNDRWQLYKRMQTPQRLLLQYHTNLLCVKVDGG
jgi:hypothetical protein